MKNLNLNEFTYDQLTFNGPYGPIVHNSYTLEKDGYKIVIFTLADGKWWTAALYKNGKTIGEARTQKTPEKILEEINQYFENLK